MRGYQKILIPSVITFFQLLFLSPNQVVTCFIILGQAHFILTYCYQARAGKMGISYFLRYAIAVVLLMVFWSSTGYSPAAILILAGFLFAIHFSIDEAYLAGLEANAMLTFAILPIVLLYTAFIIDYSLHIEFVTIAFILSLISSCIYLWKNRTYEGLYIIGIGALLCGAIMSGLPIAPEKILGSIILFHYTRWYLNFWERTKGTKIFVPFIRDVLVANILMGVLYCLYSKYEGFPYLFVLKYIFLPQYFYCWVILHITSSIRLNWLLNQLHSLTQIKSYN